MGYHWTDSSPWHAQQRRQHLEAQARRRGIAAARAQRSANELEAENARLRERIAELETAQPQARPAALSPETDR